MENVVELDGDRFAEVVENVKLSESLKHVLHYVTDIANNDENGHEAFTCQEVLESMQENVNTAIDDAIA